MKNFFYNFLVLLKYSIKSKKMAFNAISLTIEKSNISHNAKVYAPAAINEAAIGDYTYVSPNSNISKAVIGKFGSIGPNFICGYGIHPLSSISSSPVFYTKEGIENKSFCTKDKFETRKSIVIGNDVFIGANVTVLDGVTIGNGAVIGAGAVVVKDIPAYAIAVGVPAKVIKYRFNEEQIARFGEINWWDWPEERLFEVEKSFFDVEGFLEQHKAKS